MKLFIFVILISALQSVYTENDAPRVKTPVGAIKGYYRTSYKGRQFEAYEGIPYAVPPTGKLRFKVILENLTCRVS